MRIIWIAAILLIAIVILSCRSTKSDESEVSEAALIFGNGGGFAGLITEYSLDTDGRLMTRSSIEGPWTELGKIESRQVDQIYQQLSILELDSYTYNRPGNRYQFITLDKTPEPHRIVWGAAGDAPKKEVVILYQILMDLVKKAKGTKK